MIVFFIHGVNTQQASYANHLIKNMRGELKNPKNDPIFYASFWGNQFNNLKHQMVSNIETDFRKACSMHPEHKILHKDMYRYRDQRSQFINSFLGDFLVYQNKDRGQQIRRILLEQLNQCLKDHPNETELHFVAHSLGSLILWDLLFVEDLERDDPAFTFREIVGSMTVKSISPLGSPLLFFKQMLNLDFSDLHLSSFLKENKSPYKLQWVNIIHSSDLVAYPLMAAIKSEISPDIFFSDQYVWQDANSTEATLHLMSGQSDAAMAVAAEDAHSSYFKNNKDGRITARLISYNLTGNLDVLKQKCVTPR